MGLAGAVVIAGALAFLLRSPLPPPRLIRAVQLTSDGRDKSSRPHLATDGLRVYFVEQVGNHNTLAAVSTSGGETALISSTFQNLLLLNISPDGSELLVMEEGSGEEGPLWVMPILGGSPRRLGDIVGHDAAWSPDGQRIAYAKGGDINLAKGDGSESRKLVVTNSGGNWAWRVKWSPDGRYLRFNQLGGPLLDKLGSGTSRLWEVTAEGTDLRPLFPAWDKGPFQGVGDWTPDGKYYVFQSGKAVHSANIWAKREKISFFEKASREPVQLTVGPLDFWAPLPSRDGKRVFVLGAQRRGELVRYDTKFQRLSPYLFGISAEGVSFSADGAWVVYVKYPQGELWRSKVDGSQQVQLTFPPLVAAAPRWSPDSKRIAFLGRLPGKEWSIYVVTSGGGIPSEAVPAEEGRGDATWSPDGNSMIFGRADATWSPDGNALIFGRFGGDGIQIKDLQTRRLSSVPGSKGLCCPRWSPDGRYIAATSDPSDELLLFDFTTQTWVELAKMSAGVGFVTLSRDGKHVYFESYGTDPAIFRIGINNRKLERVLGLKDVRRAGTFNGGFWLDPEDSPLILRDVSAQEVYALDWEAP
jgi:Tol biopolymer transport system component